MKTNNKASDVDKLLATLERDQMEEFIRKECAGDTNLCNRFLALGMGVLFAPAPSVYSSRIEDLIEKYGGRYGYVKYRDTFEFNMAVSQIYREFESAVGSRKWDVAVAILTGISNVAEDLLNCGDDSAGELSEIVDECFAKWLEIAGMELPNEVGNHILGLAISNFRKKNLKGWDWWWKWIEIAIELAHTSNLQKIVFDTLEEIRKPVNDDWSDNYDYNQANSYKMKLMARCGTPEEQRKYMYENIYNPEFRRKLLQIAWEEDNAEEVLHIAKDGIDHDAQYAGLVMEWKKWEMKVYMKKDEVPEILRLAREFFLSDVRGELRKFNEFSKQEMYSLMKAKVDTALWPEWLEGLIRDVSKSQYLLLYIFTQEKLWDRYMDYIRANPMQYLLEEAPSEVRSINEEEFIRLYAGCIESHFKYASDRTSYRDGASMLKRLISFGGRNEAMRIIEQQKERRPRRPALIAELSTIK